MGQITNIGHLEELGTCWVENFRFYVFTKIKNVRDKQKIDVHLDRDTNHLRILKTISRETI